jgi:hypothetical protein
MFNKIFRRFNVSLAYIKPVRIRAPGMTMQFNSVAAPFKGFFNAVFFKRVADLFTPAVFIHTEVVNPREISVNRDLGNIVNRNKTNNPIIVDVN